MLSTFSGDETTPFFGFIGVADALVFSCMGAAYGTAKSGAGVASMGVMRLELSICGLIILLITSTSINTKVKSYYLFDGYAD
ncbi:v-type proton ATPase subunit c2 [Phtheirospermum japonicum]|uniref:V-type proton ATPase subunit c2 n=1 Tax=Phtheirospermum japonicum TaxID=374723 RepID=A0A830CE71_9LAMI|nr:v-type proton ATPase subunit c2 [Phtheirospermum japonicum]